MWEGCVGRRVSEEEWVGRVNGESGSRGVVWEVCVRAL